MRKKDVRVPVPLDEFWNARSRQFKLRTVYYQSGDRQHAERRVCRGDTIVGTWRPTLPRIEIDAEHYDDFYAEAVKIIPLWEAWHEREVTLVRRCYPPSPARRPNDD